MSFSSPTHKPIYVVFYFREEDDLYNGDADAEDPKDGDKKRKKKVGEAMTKQS